MGSYISSWFSRKQPETPVSGMGERLSHVAKMHFRGIVGTLVTIIALCWQIDLKNCPLTSCHIWIFMFIFFLLQPVPIQVTGMIPIFAVPLLGIMHTVDLVSSYWNEGISLYIVGGMIHLLLNNSGFDRRFALNIICKGSFTPMGLLFRCSLASFIMSALSHRLIVASTIIGYMTPIFMDLQAATAKYRATEPDYNKIRYVINNGIQTSSSIGGLVLVHASYCTLGFRAIFAACVPKGKEYLNMMNYLQITAFALPLAIVLFIVNFIYHAILLKVTAGKTMSTARQTEIEMALKKHQSKIPAKITNHEKWTILFEVLALMVLLGRWNEWTKTGWASFSIGTGETIPKVKDATAAAFFLILLHILPRSYGFIKIFTAKKQSEMPPLKPESAILFWRFVDKNTNYSYFFVIGGAISLWSAANTIVKVESTKKGVDIIIEKFNFLINLDFTIALLVICIITVILCNIMSGMAALAIFLPFVICLRSGEDNSPWVKSLYRPALAVGLTSSMGFMSPFLYTPAYFCHHTGKVPKLAMIKNSLIACILAAVIIWVAVTYYAPLIFDDFVYGPAPSTAVPYGQTTTEAPPEGAAPPAEGRI